MNARELLARVLYRDPLMLVIDKPAGLPVHSGPKGGDNLERHFEHLRLGLPQPPSLAHRLDRDTSGCLVLGRHRRALRKLGRLFQGGRIEKVYWAVVAGAPAAAAGTVALPLRKLTPRRGWKMIVDKADGQPAVTDYRVMGRAGTLTWLELRPRTGRTHQIRVHCQTLGCPIVGDAVYGGGGERPLHLHARAITVPLYPDRPPVRVVAPVPGHMADALRACGLESDAVGGPPAQKPAGLAAPRGE